jgi:hypothetical protein
MTAGQTTIINPPTRRQQNCAHFSLSPNRAQAHARANDRNFVSLALLIGLTAHAAVAQDRSASAAPTEGATVTWKRVVRLRGGRTFVSDGSFALEAALAKSAVLPSDVLPEATAKLVETYLAAELPDEFSLSQLTISPGVKKYVAPSGVVLNPIYVDYLRRTLPGSRFRFRMKSDLEPVVIVLDGKAVGLLMPMKR